MRFYSIDNQHGAIYIQMKKVLLIIGTRPEAIKMAPVAKIFSQSEALDFRLCSTGQHKEMLDQVLQFFNLTADYDLGLMKPGQNLFSLTSDILLSLKDVLSEFDPDYVFVHGDTLTCMASSLAAFYHGSKVCHIEAGLRTYNKQSPFPEEANRQITARLADIHFAPTVQAKENLLSENISEKTIVITGNTVIDALHVCLEILKHKESDEIEKLKSIIDTDKDIILVTGHRRENHGSGFDNICKGLKRISELPDVQIIYPVHLNPKVKGPVYENLNGVENISLIDPLSYESFIWLMNKSKIIITDSGGIQEEAPSLGKPVLVMRDTTERPEAVDKGTVILIGTDEQKLFSETKSLLEDEVKYKQMSELHNPYGDGKASVKILEHLLNHINDQ